MEKPLLWLLFVLATCVIAGVYGAAHNQISYGVSPEYFLAFKFRQFGISAPFQNRLGAAIVGWEASWWMGAIVGMPLATLALVAPGRSAAGGSGVRGYVSVFVIAGAVAVGTTFAVGLASLGYACVSLTAATAQNLWTPPGVNDPLAFWRAGTMHNFSYLGGLLSILTGCASIVIHTVRARTRRAHP